jgi:competence protein ComEC
VRGIPAGVARVAEQWLETERSQLALWSPVALAAGIVAWFALPARTDWIAFICLCLAGATALLLAARGAGRLARTAGLALLLMAAGCLLPWSKAALIDTNVLAQAAFVTMDVVVERVEPLPGRGMTRIFARPQGRADLPRRVRLNLEDGALPDAMTVAPGDTLRIRARLMPPAPASLPGGYDYARRAYFEGIGATGRIVPPVIMLGAGPGQGLDIRNRLSGHVARQVEGAPGAIAVTLATGDRGRITPEDEEAMRQSGLAHLLSISGLHVTALVGIVVLLSYRLLALSTRLALRWPLMLISAAVGAGAGVGYTLLTGAEVPTIRSCVSALLIMAGLALGREAISLRLLAAGALLIMLLWPESVIGPSFQFSFMAVIVIVSLYEHPKVRAVFAARDEAPWRRLLRGLGALLLTGLAVEIALMPIALYHFHKTGLLGALANMVAIPLTEFIIMPAEGLALLLDVAGLGAPAWWVVEKALALLIALAHLVAAQTSAVVLTPAIPPAAFAVTMLGFLWCLLWRSALRWAGLPIIALGLVGYAAAPVPDLLVSADGHHVAARLPDGSIALLRDRAGDYMRDQFSELSGVKGPARALTDLPAARCSSDLCAMTLRDGERASQILMTRSRMPVPWPALVESCAASDIVIADRRMPRGCQPRWLKIDRPDLASHGGAAIDLEGRRVWRSRDPRDEHPWIPARRSR